MLEDLKQPLKEGESFKGSFTFEKAGRIDVTFSIEFNWSYGAGRRRPYGSDEGHGSHERHVT